MRNFISILMTVALVLATMVAPSVSHAMPRDGAKAVKTEASKGHDCHQHGEAKTDSQKTDDDDKSVSRKCCDKGICKCIGGNCHSLSQYISNSVNLLASVPSSSSAFGFYNQFVDSALPNRLKRPPRA